MKKNPLIGIYNCGFKMGQTWILKDISWELWPGQNWLFKGPNGSGKTSLLRLIHGDILPARCQGYRFYYLCGQSHQSPLASRRYMAMLTPELQQAYRRYQINLRGKKVVQTGLGQTFFLYHKPDLRQLEYIDFLFGVLEINCLAEKPFLEMSNGEQKKILVARSLALQPRVLILDELLQGFDEQSQSSWLDFLQKISNQGVQLLISAFDNQTPRSLFSHICCLEKGRISYQGSRAKDIYNNDILQANIDSGSESQNIDSPLTQNQKSSVFCQLCNVTVRQNDRNILENFSWTIRNNEHWAIKGPNASGKTTLLKVLMGQIYPYAGKGSVSFGANGQFSVADMKPNIGYLGPELHAQFYEPELTVFSAVSTGLFKGQTRNMQLNDMQQAMVQKALSQTNMLDRSLCRISTLSYGQYSRVLLARAIVASPCLLLLDEPCNGMDNQGQQALMQIVEDLAQKGTRIIYVSHDAADLPRCITNVLSMRSEMANGSSY